MPKIFQQYEIETVVKLASQGLKDKEIAKKLGWNHKTAERTVAKIRRDAQKTEKQRQIEYYGEEEERLLDTMSRKARVKYIESTMLKSPRAKAILDELTVLEKELFLDEYYKILRSTDSITEAEEQALFSAMLEYVLHFRCLRLDAEEYKMYNETMQNRHKKGDIRFRDIYVGNFKRDAEKHFQQWLKLMESLKATREQRLKELRRDRKTIVDLAAELSSKNKQAEALQHIERYNKLNDEELRRAIKSGELFGDFGLNEENND